MRTVKRSYGPGEANEYVSGGGPSTADEVSITTDGRWLDSAEAVIEFFAELERERAREHA
ncbi:MAG: hypothetical protein MUF83_22880 [Acidimicrobiales bacterium]|nr:hypothetical protein [Acidimicrobiales bacterium]